MPERKEDLLEALAVLDSAANDLVIFRDIGIFRSPGSEHGDGPIAGFVNCICAGELRAARACFSQLEAELISGGFGSRARRISGNLLTDAILETILLSDNAFSRLAAQGIMDVPLFNAMQSELTALERLNRLSEEDFINILNSLCTPQRDAASVVANAAWSGTSARHVPKEYSQRRDPMAGRPMRAMHSWDYGEFELTGTYFADEALAEMYRRFIMTEEWGKLTESLWSFHATYGTGDFLRYRNFRFDGGIRPIAELNLREYIDFSFSGGTDSRAYEPEYVYNILLKNAIAFMRDEDAVPMLLIGSKGSGKTRMLLHLVEELPELRLVSVTGDCNGLQDLFELLSGQPGKFMILLDDMKQETAGFTSGAAIPENLLIAGTMDGCEADLEIQSFFGLIVKLDAAEAKDAAMLKSMVKALLEGRAIEFDQERIDELCRNFSDGQGAGSGRQTGSGPAAAERIVNELLLDY